MGDLEHEYARQWEGIAFYPQENHKFTKRPTDIISVQRVLPNNLTHPNEKPVDVLFQIIKSHGVKTVLDPFCGSGSTLVACKQAGVDYIGIDISQKNCEIAQRRLAQEYIEFS
jgi:site-specific DNA-methyltransferase (adenine-specific)